MPSSNSSLSCPNIVSFVISHNDSVKPNQFPERDVLIVGQNHCSGGFRYWDSSGDNISKKNPSYCELTGLYWIWKNVNSEVVSFEHYRRLFLSPASSPFSYSFIMKRELSLLLSTHDAILPKQMVLRDSLYEQYRKKHHVKDLDACIGIVRQLFPEYGEDIQKVFFRGNHLYPFNMFVFRKADLDEYCKWLFGILTLVEQNIDCTGYDQYQRRVFGFLSERLFTLWIFHNRLNAKECRVALIGQAPFKNFLLSVEHSLPKIH